MKEVPIKYFHLGVGFVGVTVQSWAFLEVLAHAFVNVNAVQKTPAPGWLVWPLICSFVLMLWGLSSFAREKGRSWLWGLFTLGLSPGWLLGAVVLLLCRDKSREK